MQRFEALGDFGFDLRLYFLLQQILAARYQVTPGFVLTDDLYHHTGGLLFGIGGKNRRRRLRIGIRTGVAFLVWLGLMPDSRQPCAFAQTE
ncbi:hypothetical protein D3C78_1275350 [compost metagenome]